MEMTKTNSRNQ